MIDIALQLVSSLSATQGYACFCFVIIICCLGVPLSSDLMLVLAAYFATQGYFEIQIVMILGYLSLLLGDSINYWCARHWGERLIKTRPLCFIFTPEKTARAQVYFNNQGSKFLYLLRFMPLMRATSLFTLGMLQVRPSLFYIANMTTTALYIPLLMGITYYTGKNLDVIIATLKTIQQFFMLGFILLAIVFFYTRSKRKM